LKITRALISVSDKTGIAALARALEGQGVDIISTGGTADLLRKEKIPVREISSFTAFPEVLEGRVKTLHPRVHGGLLYLRGGEWDGARVVPADWVDASTSPSPSYAGYGYQWWLGTGASLPDYFSARGHDGQYIYVVPSLDLVVVRSGHYDKYAGEPVADPSLWARLPSDGLIEGAGTRPPEDGWDDEEFLGPIVAAIER